jgi:hypothetical protein
MKLDRKQQEMLDGKNGEATAPRDGKTGGLRNAVGAGRRCRGLVLNGCPIRWTGRILTSTYDMGHSPLYDKFIETGTRVADETQTISLNDLLQIDKYDEEGYP